MKKIILNVLITLFVSTVLINCNTANVSEGLIHNPIRGNFVSLTISEDLPQNFGSAKFNYDALNIDISSIELTNLESQATQRISDITSCREYSKTNLSLLPTEPVLPPTTVFDLLHNEVLSNLKIMLIDVKFSYDIRNALASATETPFSYIAFCNTTSDRELLFLILHLDKYRYIEIIQFKKNFIPIINTLLFHPANTACNKYFLRSDSTIIDMTDQPIGIKDFDSQCLNIIKKFIYKRSFAEYAILFNDAVMP
ncbi:hypothetical protein COTS27_00259 [Spirochaetota bacterium]|nr:hypothetical protein COTS27_00259 [Spirochaetota bacterium]